MIVLVFILNGYELKINVSFPKFKHYVIGIINMRIILNYQLI